MVPSNAVTVTAGNESVECQKSHPVRLGPTPGRKSMLGTPAPPPATAPPAAPTRRPAPGWPFWVAFGVLVPATLIGLLLATFVGGASASTLANQERLLGTSAVVRGTFADSEPVSALPEVNSFYTVTLPSTAPGDLANSAQTLAGDTNVGFPPSDEFPATRDFLVSYEGNSVRVEDVGRPGSLDPVTDSTVAAAQRTVGVVTGVLVAGWVWLALVITVLPTLAIRFSIRRRRAAR